MLADGGNRQIVVEALLSQKAEMVRQPFEAVAQLNEAYGCILSRAVVIAEPVGDETGHRRHVCMSSGMPPA